MGISRKISSRKRRERKRIKAELRNNLEYFLYISLHFYAYFSPFSFFFLFLSNRFGEKRERDWKGLESLWEPRQNLIINSVLSTFYPRKKWEESEKNCYKNPSLLILIWLLYDGVVSEKIGRNGEMVRECENLPQRGYLRFAVTTMFLGISHIL